jgi:hypothetical protein
MNFKKKKVNRTTQTKKKMKTMEVELKIRGHLFQKPFVECFRK